MCLIAPVQDRIWLRNIDISVKGGDRVNADGIPLYTIMNGQNALFLDQLDGVRACITLPPIGSCFFRGEPDKWMVLGTTPGNAAFC